MPLKPNNSAGAQGFHLEGLLACLLLAWLVSCGHGVSAPARVVLSPPDELSPIVGVAVGEEQPWCTGFAIGRRAVMTARHCLPRSSVRATVSVVQYGPSAIRRLRVREVIRPVTGPSRDDRDLLLHPDVVILIARQPLGTPVLRLAQARPQFEAGDLVSAARLTPASLEERRTVYATRARVLDGDNRFIFTTPASCRGDSGGPLLDTRGLVVGVASASGEGACEEQTSIFTAINPLLFVGSAGWSRLALASQR